MSMQVKDLCWAHIILFAVQVCGKDVQGQSDSADDRGKSVPLSTCFKIIHDMDLLHSKVMLLHSDAMVLAI